MTILRPTQIKVSVCLSLVALQLLGGPVHAFWFGIGNNSNACLVDKTGLQQAIQPIIKTYLRQGRTGRDDAAVAIFQTDKDGNIIQKLFEKNSEYYQPVASTQKLLTAYTAYKLGMWDSKIVFKAEDRRLYPYGWPMLLTGKTIYLNNTVTVKEFIYPLLDMRQSSNQAAEAISRTAREQLKIDFVRAMNKNAEEILGSKTLTVFSDPSGLSARQQSSATDMAIMTAKMLADQNFKKLLISAGIGSLRNGVFEKNGYISASGRTRIILWPVNWRSAAQAPANNRTKESCDSEPQYLSIALFGMRAFDQFYNFLDHFELALAPVVGPIGMEQVASH